jgi:hypothetical protein
MRDRSGRLEVFRLSRSVVNTVALRSAFAEGSGAPAACGLDELMPDRTGPQGTTHRS